MAHIGILTVVLLSTINTIICIEVRKFPLVMDNVHPDRDDLYLCTPFKIVPNNTYYIVGFEPKASMDVIHHMLVFGCSEPGTKEKFWDCGEMAASNTNDNRWAKAPPCQSKLHVIYAWARNAGSWELPEDVGFQVGAGSDIRYLVLQNHYQHGFSNEQKDSSGIFLKYTQQPQSKLAGVLLLATGGQIPPNSITKMETQCSIDEDKVIHPLAYRTHTHGLGLVVSGYRVQRDENGVDHWILLGKRDPLTPQMFYPVFDKTPIRQGDHLAARCTMDSRSRTTYTNIGPTNKDEMCNFYLIYYVENGTPLSKKYCVSEGPPFYHWTNTNFNHIPDIEASSLY